jgi:hypothetical protein
MGYVTSTPNSKPTAIIGIIEAPTTKQQRVTTQVSPDKKLKAVPTLLITERIEIIITDSLYVFFSSTQIPKQADPTRPPIIKTAPNCEASDYNLISHIVSLPA